MELEELRTQHGDDCSGVWADNVTGVVGSGTGNYWGELCQYAPPCDSNPCLNTGVCTNLGGSQYSCDCGATSNPYSLMPFDGPRCEHDTTTPCDLDPCLNAGVCTNSATAAGGYSCACVGGWSGQSCGIPPVDVCLLPASADICGQFGKCVASTNPVGVVGTAPFTQCVCFYGYSGAACATPPPACTADYTASWQKRDVEQRQSNAAYCLNNAACIGLGGSAQHVACLCRDPWVGSRCQWNSTIFAGASTYGASLMTVLLLAVVALF